METLTTRPQPAQLSIEQARPAADAAVTKDDLLRELRFYWHPVAASRDVKDKPLGAKLLDEQLVLFRQRDGGVACLRDFCLHRGTQLSLGWLDKGNLVCLYHGWTYDGSGQCVRIPSLPAERGIPRRARAVSFQTQEKYGLVWVLLEARAKAPIFELEQFGAPGWRATLCGPWPVKAHATRVVENFLDVAHPAWVHPGLLDDRGGGLIQPYECRLEDGEVIAEYELWEPYPDWKAEAYGVDKSILEDGYVRVLYTSHVVRPLTVYGYKRAPGGDQIIFFSVCPRAEDESIAFLYMIRTVELDKPDDPFREFQELLWEQDKRVLESQRPYVTPIDLREEMHVSPPDVVNVAYRRYLQSIARGDARPGSERPSEFGQDVLETG